MRAVLNYTATIFLALAVPILLGLLVFMFISVERVNSRYDIHLYYAQAQSIYFSQLDLVTTWALPAQIQPPAGSATLTPESLSKDLDVLINNQREMVNSLVERQIISTASEVLFLDAQGLPLGLSQNSPEPASPANLHSRMLYVQMYQQSLNQIMISSLDSPIVELLENEIQTLSDQMWEAQQRDYAVRKQLNFHTALFISIPFLISTIIAGVSAYYRFRSLPGMRS